VKSSLGYRLAPRADDISRVAFIAAATRVPSVFLSLSVRLARTTRNLLGLRGQELIAGLAHLQHTGRALARGDKG
jgi:hypothetical protein